MQEEWRRHGQTLGQLLKARADLGGTTPFVTLVDDTMGEVNLSYGDLFDGARRTATALLGHGVSTGGRVMLGLPTGREFLETFFGLQLLGAAAVPFYPPARKRGLEETTASLARLIMATDPDLIVVPEALTLPVAAAAHIARTRAAVVGPCKLDGHGHLEGADVSTDQTALIQFTSGSTRTPRGVPLTHRQLLQNIEATLRVVGTREGDVVVSWLPLYHDMGLIGLMLMPLFGGLRLVLMSPQSFLLDPKRWLHAVDRHRGTISAAPNFAYQLIANRLKDSELTGLDLSSWRFAGNGAEPVMTTTLRAFADRLAPYGFREEALTPIYGLAEVAVAAAFSPTDRLPRIDRVQARLLEQEGLAQAAPADDAMARSFVSAGEPLPGYRMRIIGPEGPLAERQLGELQIQGPSVMAGYVGPSEAEVPVFDDGWLRTGDLAYMADGELFVVGRSKDMVVKAGRKFAPQDLEHLAGEIAGVRRGCVAVFGVADAASGTEKMVVVAETREAPDRHQDLARAISLGLSEGLGIRPDHVTLLPPGSLPKTSSGKIRRARCKESWIQGTLQPATEPSLWSRTRMVRQALAHRLIRGGTRD